eukprot:CAMPEP_0170754518 /NCGR_PEP_ID=MMETSP0437-20130122/13044_1 /TAXON_ID=0 /ORGANISM="Sexangularia sp." /LENGTH=460 /DNA_ID=CAMNT_0011093659 /DNA_START=165 /DNA_END=1547 /DNA_ORIENTATION=+
MWGVLWISEGDSSTHGGPVVSQGSTTTTTIFPPGQSGHLPAFDDTNMTIQSPLEARMQLQPLVNRTSCAQPAMLCAGLVGVPPPGTLPDVALVDAVSRELTRTRFTELLGVAGEMCVEVLGGFEALEANDEEHAWTWLEPTMRALESSAGASTADAPCLPAFLRGILSAALMPRSRGGASVEDATKHTGLLVSSIVEHGCNVVPTEFRSACLRFLGSSLYHRARLIRPDVPHAGHKGAHFCTKGFNVGADLAACMEGAYLELYRAESTREELPSLPRIACSKSDEADRAAAKRKHKHPDTPSFDLKEWEECAFELDDDKTTEDLEFFTCARLAPVAYDTVSPRDTAGELSYCAAQLPEFTRPCEIGVGEQQASRRSIEQLRAAPATVAAELAVECNEARLKNGSPDEKTGRACFVGVLRRMWEVFGNELPTSLCDQIDLAPYDEQCHAIVDSWNTHGSTR